MLDPVVTYRLQFNKHFTFSHLESVIPYLENLGIRCIYASPIFESVPGSMHGYDGVNPHRIDPEIGTEEEFRNLGKILREKNIKWIQDIVPNHMAFHKNNLWLMDVLEKGRYSVYAHFFDLAWAGDLFHGRIIIPILNDKLEDVLFNKKIQLGYEGQRFVITFNDNCYPLHPRSYRLILDHADAPDVVQLLTAQIASLHHEDHSVSYSLRWHELLLQLNAIMQQPAVAAYITERLDHVNHDGIALKEVLDQQTYALTAWQTTDEKISFRRFFTVNELIGVNIQDAKVFDHYHTYLKALIDEGLIHGVRVDHIDGLLDPEQYLGRLRTLVGDDRPVWVEKILKHDEQLPSWPVQGETGYSFMASVNQLMTNKRSYHQLSELYADLIGAELSLSDEIYKKKAYVLDHHMQGELDNLYRLFLALNLVKGDMLSKTVAVELKELIREFLIRCPVYRFYGNKLPLRPEEANAIDAILTNIARDKSHLAYGAGLLRSAWLEPSVDPERAIKFYQRCMQFTGPLMAKGVEDTLFYTYNLFIGHNEVGDSPEVFGINAWQFHEHMIERQRHWPLSLNATATHDTKRGEDARARLNVLTEMPGEWTNAVTPFMRASSQGSGEVPDANDVYFILQTIVGTFPLSHEHLYAERIEAYIIKALREGKQHSAWAAPDEDYENKAIFFIRSIFDKHNPASTLFHDFLKSVTDGGLINSLVQIVLKFTCPGVPDVYQGCEGLDFSLVDPDNRQLIDYKVHHALLMESSGLDESSRLYQLWDNRRDGSIKQWIISRLSRMRSLMPSLFSFGDYIPLKVTGKYRDHVLAFARSHQGEWSATVVPLFTSSLAKEQNTLPFYMQWDDTAIEIPPEVPRSWKNMLSHNTGSHVGTILLSTVLDKFPMAVLSFQKDENARGAGILMPVSSLHSPFAIGDFGPSAFAFANFLQDGGQRYWQLLPLNPTSESMLHSPYGSYSSMAGNTLLISPELLVNEGLLSSAQIDPFRQKAVSRVEYRKAGRQKEVLMQYAWDAFLQKNDNDQNRAFKMFMANEDDWLHDFALFVVLKRVHNNVPWNEWPTELRNRHDSAIEIFAARHEQEINKVKWLQFIFQQQWKTLKTYCNSKDVALIGDIPFYVVYDSADVWAHRQFFTLNDDNAISYVAGVPPDYFNDNGQLWGMPVFNWEAIRADDYRWWINRLRRNISLFDIVRLDHFRAFAAFWRVPTSERTAVNGKWIDGPGSDFLNKAMIELGKLPFLAEDLGEITKDVHKLRGDYKLPGMKVLQFAFGKDSAESVHAPHNFEHTNFFVYTGTHDNNTTRGWFAEETGEAARRRLSDYAGKPVTERNINDVMLRLAYSSVAKVAILPMQDILDLEGAARLNLPGSTDNNWCWRMDYEPGASTAASLRMLTTLYNRSAAVQGPKL